MLHVAKLSVIAQCRYMHVSSAEGMTDDSVQIEGAIPPLGMSVDI